MAICWGTGMAKNSSWLWYSDYIGLWFVLLLKGEMKCLDLVWHCVLNTYNKTYPGWPVLSSTFDWNSKRKDLSRCVLVDILIHHWFKCLKAHRHKHTHTQTSTLKNKAYIVSPSKWMPFLPIHSDIEPLRTTMPTGQGRVPCFTERHQTRCVF